MNETKFCSSHAGCDMMGSLAPCVKKCKRGVFVYGMCVSRVCVVLWCSMFKLFQLLKVQRELKLDNIAPQLRTIL